MTAINIQPSLHARLPLINADVVTNNSSRQSLVAISSQTRGANGDDQSISHGLSRSKREDILFIPTPDKRISPIHSQHQDSFWSNLSRKINCDADLIHASSDRNRVVEPLGACLSHDEANESRSGQSRAKLQLDPSKNTASLPLIGQRRF